jgi:cysteine-rich repeat protein
VAPGGTTIYFSMMRIDVLAQRTAHLGSRRRAGILAMGILALVAWACGGCMDNGTTLCGDLRCPPGTVCTADRSGCTSNLCGNGRIDVEVGEVCDDGNVKDGDGCRGDCLSQEICGDSITDAYLGEECDRGEENSNNGGLCSLDCKKRCTGMSLDEGELCDDPLFAVSCLDFGYHRGRIGCRNCEPLLGMCRMIGWVRAKKPVGVGDLHDVWGVGSGTIFAVGQEEREPLSAVLRYDGRGWSLMAVPYTVGVLLGVWASGTDDLFAVGEAGRVLYHDGQAWVRLNAGTEATLHDVWSHGIDADVLVVGERATVRRLRREEQQWVAEPLPAGLPGQVTLRGVWGSGPDDVFVVGDGGVILHRTRDGWQRAAEGLTTAKLAAVWGSGPGDVFAVGEAGTILHYDGQRWSRMAADSTLTLEGIWGSGPGHVIAVGRSGTILFYDGVSWTALEPGTDLHLAGVWGGGNGTFVAVGRSGMILQHAGQSWATRKPRPADQALHRVWASASNDIHALAASEPYLLRFDGRDWQAMTDTAPGLGALVPVPPDGEAPLRGLWGNLRGDIYAVGVDSTILHRNPEGTWSRVALDPDIPARTLHAVWGTAEGYVFAVGEGVQGEDDALILRYDGQSWQRMPSGTDASLYGVWGNTLSDVLAVGESGVVLHHTDDRWSRVITGIDETLHGVWGSVEGEAYVVGGRGTILRRIGATWSTSLSGQPTPWRSIWGSARTDIYAVGFDGTIFHFSDGAWSPVSSQTDHKLLTVWGVRNPSQTAQTVIFAGEGGTFLRLVASKSPGGY